MRRFALLAILLLCGPTVAADDAVTADLEWEPGGIGSYRSLSVTFAEQPPEGVAALDGVESARYASIRLGDVRHLALAIDTNPDRPRLWVDSDMDGSLADERGVDWERRDTTLALERTVRVPFSDHPVPVPIPIYFYRPQADHAGPVRYYAKIHREGAVVLAGRLRKVALVDANGDLCFDDLAKAHFYVDVDGDGAFAAGHGTHEHIHFGNPFALGGRGWTADVPEVPGGKLVFRPTSDPPPPSARTWKELGRSEAGAAQTPPPETIAELLAEYETIRDRPYAERSPLLAKIGRTGEHDALDFLLSVARDDTDTNVRNAAARALGNPAFLERGAKDVVRLASGNPPALAAAAVQALYGMGHPDRRKILLELLTSSESAVVGAAARHLAYEADAELARRLVAGYEKVSTPALRYQVYQGLRYLASGPPPELMLSAAREDYASLQGMALRDLHSIGHADAGPLARELAERRPVVDTLALACVDVLGALGDEDAVEALLGLADAGSPRVAGAVVKRLAPLRDRLAVDVLLAALKAKSARVRTLAAQVLAGIPEAYVTDELLRRATRERDEETAAALIEALGDHGDPRAIDVLLKAAKIKKRELLRVVAIRALARVGLTEPRVRDFFLALLQSPRWEDRVFAIDAAAEDGEPKLVKKVLPNLAHDRRQVRLAAAQAFARLRAAEAVEPMIERLAVEELQRVRNALANALFRTTGMNLYDETALWQQWWTDTGGRFQVPEAVPELPKLVEGATGAAFYGIAVDSDHVTFVVDQSGSMSAPDVSRAATGDDDSRNRFDVAVGQVLAAVGQLPDDAYANVVLFHSTVHPWHDELRRLSKKTRQALSKHLLDLRPTGGTNLYDGLETALLDPEVDTVLLLSDGVPGAGRFVAADDIVRAVRRINQTRRTTIHCVSLGRESQLLRRLAAENGGEYARR